jgi:hypothetical protein
MNENNLKKGIENLQKTKLSEVDKQAMFVRLSTYVDENLPQKRMPAMPILSWFSMFHFRTPGKYVLASLFALVLGTGIAYGAEGALPGDLLYPIKIHLSEPIRGAFKAPSEKTNWESEKFDRRINEAEKLVSKDKLSEKHLVEVEKQIDIHKDKFTEKEFKQKVLDHKEKLENIKVPDNAERNEKIDRLERKLEMKPDVKSENQGENSKPERAEKTKGKR